MRDKEKIITSLASNVYIHLKLVLHNHGAASMYLRDQVEYNPS